MDSCLLEATSIPTFWFIIYVNGLFICIFRCNTLLRQGWDYTHRAGDISVIFHTMGIAINFEGVDGTDARIHTEGGCSTWSKWRVLHELNHYIHSYIYPAHSESYRTLKRRASFSVGDKSHAHPSTWYPSKRRASV